MAIKRNTDGTINMDEFENHLKDAINDTAVAKDMATGTVPSGTFNGIASIRLLSDLGE